MQRLSGKGTAFLEIDGYVKEYDLAAGQSMIIDTVIWLLCQAVVRWILRR